MQKATTLERLEWWRWLVDSGRLDDDVCLPPRRWCVVDVYTGETVYVGESRTDATDWLVTYYALTNDPRFFGLTELRVCMQ